MIDLESEQSDEQLRETGAEIPTRFFLGEPLKAFSYGRQIAFERVLTRQTQSDTNASVCLVYLCTVDKENYDRTRTRDGIGKFIDDMETWAELKRIGITGRLAKEVKRLADEILSEIEASDFDVQVKPGQRSRESPDPNA